MKVSLAWLSEYTEVPRDVGQLSSLLTFAGIEVEGIRRVGADFSNVVVGKIVSFEKHPNADRLSVCKVDDGTGELRQIVCGAKNFKAGDCVPLALPGAVLPGDFRIKVGKLRGVESGGMLCSAKELELADDADGLLILSPEARPGAPIAEVIPPDVVIEIEVTPNRPDLLGHFGIARELAALSGKALKRPSAGGEPSAEAGLTVTVEESDLCPLYSARLIRGVKVGPSPDWLRRRLEAVGLRSINNIVDVTNFVMLELGQPLHAFDAGRLNGGLNVRRAKVGERFHALDGKEYKLRAHDLAIADQAGVVALAGVMGGEGSGVVGETVDIVLESACFLASAIRRTSRELGLISDSSYRFERGVDPAGVLAASARAAALIAEVAGGDVGARAFVVGDPEPRRRVVAFRYGRCSGLLGEEIAVEEADRVLSGFGLNKVSGDAVQASFEVPTYRPDLTREVDLIEEVSRVHGIDRLPPGHTRRVMPPSAEDGAYDFRLGLARRLAGFGFSEVRTMKLISPAMAEADPFRGGSDVLRVKNPLSEEHAVLRPGLVPGLLKVAAWNVRQGAAALRFFEIGTVFGGEREEEDHLGVLMAGPVRAADWRDAKPRAVDLFDLKGVVEGLAGCALQFDRETGAEAGLRVRVAREGKMLGWLMQFYPSQAAAHDIAGPLVVAELRVAELAGMASALSRFQPLERFPAVRLDIAMIVGTDVTHGQVVSALEGANERLLEGVELFDVFEDLEGIKVPAGKKSLAYSLTYRSSERTLTSEEVTVSHGRLKELLKAQVGASFRE